MIKAALATLLLLPPLLSAKDDQSQTGFRFGERPKNGVFDPAGILTIKEQADLAEPLGKVRKQEGIDVLVVILPEIGEAPPQHVAEGFSVKWAEGNVNAVVLHVPGKEGSPWIFPGRFMVEAIKRETLDESILSAQKRAAAEPTDFGKVRAAATEASDALRYWMGGLRIRSEEIISEQLEQRLAHENRRRLLKLAALLGAASVIPLSVGVALIVLNVRNSRPRHFPVVRVVSRLGAPHAGGNNAVSNPTPSRP